MTYRYFLPIGVKVYSICVVMLCILLLVATGNYMKMTTVNQEVQDVARFIAPIAKTIRQTRLLALEQELLVERILRLKSADPVQDVDVPLSSAFSHFQTHWQQLIHLDTEVRRQLSDAAKLADIAISQSEIRSDIVAFARLSPELGQLTQDHFRLQNYYKTIINEFQSEKEQGSLNTLLMRQLDNQEAVFNERISRLQTWLNDFTQQSVTEIQRQDQSLLWFNAILTTIALLTGLTVAWITSMKVTVPLRRLIDGGEMIRQEHYSSRLDIKSQDEIGELTHSFNQLMQQVEDKEKLRASFQDYIDPRIIELLAENPAGVPGKCHSATVLFSDLAKFSVLSETLSPEALVAVINEHYNLSGKAIFSVGGIVDKYIGDAVVAYWCTPFVDATCHTRLACRAALNLLEKMQQLRHALPDLVGVRKGLPPIDIRIGIATGDVVTGNIGTEKKRSFSILGEPLTLAETLEQANKRYGTHILVSEATKNHAGNEFVFCFATKLKSPRGEVSVYQLCGYKDAFPAENIIQLEALDKHINQWHDKQEQGHKDQFGAFLQEQAESESGLLRENPLAQYYLNVLRSN